MQGFFSSGIAEAQKGKEEIGRYRISAWVSQSGPYTHHNGYYVVDTVTGKIVDRKAETHTSKE